MTEIKPKDWEEEFVKRFFVYKLGGKFPDHVGAEKEALDFIRKVRTDAVLEERKRIEGELKLRIGNLEAVGHIDIPGLKQSIKIINN